MNAKSWVISTERRFIKVSKPIADFLCVLFLPVDEWKKPENDFVDGVESSKVKPPEKRAIQVIFALSETSWNFYSPGNDHISHLKAA